MNTRPAGSRVQELVEQTLVESGLTFSRYDGAHGGLPGLIVELPGERKLITNTLLAIGEHSIRVEAFVCRRPDENHEGVYRFLLKRNRRIYGVAYTLDNVGDIYLIGRMALETVSADEIDRVLGQVLEAVNNDFNTLLELGFAGSIRKEWAWRVERGESLKNLKAFEHLITEDDDAGRVRPEEESSEGPEDDDAGRVRPEEESSKGPEDDDAGRVRPEEESSKGPEPGERSADEDGER